MKNKKTIIIIVSIIVVYLFLAIILFGWTNFLDKFQKSYVMLNPDTKWQLKNGKWSDITNDKVYNWKKFDVYVDNQLLGNYNLLYNKKWYLFDNNRKSVKYEGNMIAIKGNKKYKVIDFKEEDFDNTDKIILKDILEKENIDYPKEFTYAKKISLDLDGDNNIETIYTISNAFTNDTLVNYKFSIVFIKDDNIQILYKNKETLERQYYLCVPKVKAIIDFNLDSKYEIITECNYFNLLGTCNSLYQKKDGLYKIMKGC